MVVVPNLHLIIPTVVQTWMVPGNPGNIDIPPASTESGISPAHQFLYLKVKGAYGINLSTALFAKDVIAGMFHISTYGRALWPRIDLKPLLTLCY